MGRPKGSKNKKEQIRLDHDHIAHDEPLSEESRKLVEQGLQEAKEGKLEANPLVEKNNTQISDERKQKLNAVLREINKVMPGSVQYAKDIEVKERQSFGYKCLDKLTGGGIIRGNCSVIWGSKGCGKSTIAMKMIATAQKEGKIAAYLDVERSYDPVWAKRFGVDTENLVYIVCQTAESVMDTVIKLCKEKVVDLIILDSVQGLSPKGEQVEGKSEKPRSLEDDTMALLARKLSQFFRIATPAISDAKCAVLMIGQARMDLSSFIKMETLSGGHALMHNSRLILRCRRGQKTDAPSEKVETGELNEKGKAIKETVQLGFDLVVHVDKSQIQGCTEGQEIHLPFYYDGGIKE